MSLLSSVIQETLHQVLSCFFTHKIHALDQFEVLFFIKKTNCKKDPGINHMSLFKSVFRCFKAFQDSSSLNCVV